MMTEDHHNFSHPHWTDRVRLKRISVCGEPPDDRIYVTRVDDDDGSVDEIPLNQLCFHHFESGAA